MTIARFINEIGFKVKNGDVQKVNNTIADIKNTASKILGAIGIGVSLTAINNLVEEFTLVTQQVRNSTVALGDQAEIQDKILAAATATRTAYSQTAGVVADLVHENSELFGTIDEAIAFNNAATMLFKTAGKTNEEIAGLMEAINKSFAKGYVDSETLSQMLEKSPEAVELLNRQLGTTSDQLEQLATDGKFTVADLKAAFVNNADIIAAAYGNVKISVTESLTVIRNKWGLWLAETNEMLSITDSIAKTIIKASDTALRAINKVRTGVVWLSEKLGGVENLLKLFVIAAGAIWFAFNFDAISTGIATVIKFLKTGNTQALAMVAEIVLIALLIDDFVNFMQGNNSLFGSMLEKVGVDCRALRETIISAWNYIREQLLVMWDHIQAAGSKVWTAIQTAAQSIFEGLKVFWAKWGDDIKSTFSTVFSACKDIFDGFIDVLVGLADFIGAVFSGNWETAWQSILDVFTSIWDALTSFLAAKTEAMKLLFEITRDFLTNLWTKMWSSISSTLSGFLNTIWSNITGTFTNIWTSITAIVGNIKNSIVQGFQSAVNWIKSLPAQALTWGTHIIDNIIQGIKNAIGRLVSTMSNVASTIKGYIGFSEPEIGPLSNFHTYMPDMIDLMTQGIEAGRSKVTGALGDIAGDMSILVSGAGVSPKTAGNLVTNNSTRTIVLNNTFNQQFSGERAAQQNSSKAMTKAATDITGELARGLAYGR